MLDSGGAGGLKFGDIELKKWERIGGHFVSLEQAACFLEKAKTKIAIAESRIDPLRGGYFLVWIRRK